MTDLHDPWDELLEATPPGWYVGRPSRHDERNEWVMYAFDPSEIAVKGRRSREWTAIAPTEVEVAREMARCLRESRGQGAEVNPSAEEGSR